MSAWVGVLPNRSGSLIGFSLAGELFQSELPAREGMIQRIVKDKVGFVEQVDKFVDSSGNIPKFGDEGIIHSYSGAARQPFLKYAIAADREIPDGCGNTARLARAVVAQDQVSLIPIGWTDHRKRPARRVFNTGKGSW